jgi:hypothetical protein
MRDIVELVQLINSRFESSGFAQVEGYNRFGFVRVTNASIIVLREKGTEARIPLKKIGVALTAVRSDHSVYTSGPDALRKHGITHVNSPVWSLIHLLSLSEIVS